jgi:hypothetical protein
MTPANDDFPKVETVRVICGRPVDPELPMWPATVLDLQSRRLRYQVVARHLLEPLKACGDSALFKAVFCPHAGTNGRWQLIEQIEGAL